MPADNESYTQLSEDMIISEVASTPSKAVEKTVLTASEIRRNMLCCILLDAIFITGWSDLLMAQQPLLSYLHASNLFVGLITGANWAGLLGVFASPWITRRFRYKKWYMFATHIPYLAALGGVGLGVLYSKKLGLTDHSLLNFMLIMFLAHWFFGGFVSLPHQEYVAATIPMSHRGRYSGISFSVGGIAAILSALAGRVILKHYPEPISYGFLFLLAWGIIQSGYIFSLFAVELPTPVEKSPSPWSKTMLKAVWEDKPYLRFISVNIMATILFTPGIFTFVNMFGFNTLHMPKTAAADFQLVTQVARIGFSVLIGFVTDKFGPKRVLPYWMLVLCASLFLPAVICTGMGVYISVALSTIYIAGSTAAFMALLYGMPKPENRAGHYTVQLILFYAANSIGPILVGWACDMLSYRTVFFIWAGLALLAFTITKHLISSLSDDAKSYS